ncbi:MAG: hypothetical protein IH840_17935 [Candidatus Heimdallarchaeota archaeon]|nr:hypothetical protein [Candidatus Heimdallarchaeota archaeon]
MSTSLKRRSIIIVLTDLHDDPETILKGFKIAKGFHHEVQIIQITDYGEFNLPSKVGKVKFKHPETETQVVANFADPIVSGVYAYELNKKIQLINTLKRKLRGLKVRIIETHTEDLAEKVLLAYYGTKQGF